MCIFCSMAEGISDTASEAYLKATEAYAEHAAQWGAQYDAAVSTWSSHVAGVAHTLAASAAGIGMLASSLAGPAVLAPISTFALEDEPITIGVNVANKLDVALAVGENPPAEYGDGKFERDLRERLSGLLSAKFPSPVVPSDLYVTAAKAMDVSTDSTFTWWTWDHTIAPANATLGGQPKRQDKDAINQSFASTIYPSHQAFYNYVVKQANPGFFPSLPPFNDTDNQITVTSNNVTATSMTLPTHQVGDLIILAVRGAYNNNTVLTPPATSTSIPQWNALSAATTPATANNANLQLVYTVAGDTTHTSSGTWTGATAMTAVVFHSVEGHPLTVKQAIAKTNAASTSLIYPGITLAQTGDTVVRFAAKGNTQTAAAVNNPVSGGTWTRLAPISGNTLLAAHVLQNAQTNLTDETVTQTSAAYRTVTIEVGHTEANSWPATRTWTTVGPPNPVSPPLLGTDLSVVGQNYGTGTSLTLPTHQVGDLIVLAARGATAAPTATSPVPAWVDISGTLDQVTLVGATQSATNAGSVDLPPHQAGDLIVIAARTPTTTLATIPPQSGDVPAWDNHSSSAAGTNSLSLRIAYATATSDHHVSGNWGVDATVAAIVLRGAVPITIKSGTGGNGTTANATTTANSSTTYPAQTLTRLGNSVLRISARSGTAGNELPIVSPSTQLTPSSGNAFLSTHFLANATANPAVTTVNNTGANAYSRSVTLEIGPVNPWRLSYFRATATTTTSGTWTGADAMSAVVLRGNTSSGQLTVKQATYQGGQASNDVTYPEATLLTAGDGVLRIAVRGETGPYANTAPSGYTPVSPASGNSLASMYLLKDSPVQVAESTANQAASASYHAATLEIGYYGTNWDTAAATNLTENDLTKYKLTGDNKNPILAAMARDCSDPAVLIDNRSRSGVCGLITSNGNSTSYKVINDVDHIYVENHGSTSAAQTSTYNTATGYIHSTDKTNPNYGPTNATTGQTHPYDGNLFHMEESSQGSQMDFYGYGNYSYKDFRFLPNNQETTKTFEFAIAEDVAYDALDGVGFFFNTGVNNGDYGVADTSTPCVEAQCMSGYLLFLHYGNSTTSLLGKGIGMALYRFTNINTEDLHHKVAATGTNYGGIDPAITNSFKDRNNNAFVKVATAPYSSTDMTRRIKIEARPERVKVWYVGNPNKQGTETGDAIINTKLSDYEPCLNDLTITLEHPLFLRPSEENPAVLKCILGANGAKLSIAEFNALSPAAQDAKVNWYRTFYAANLLNAVNPNSNPKTALTWTVAAGGAVTGQTAGSATAEVKLDKTKIVSYGFGPIGSYWGHGCSRPTHIALQNLSMTVEKVKTLVEAVQQPEWRENTVKFLVYLSGQEIDDFGQAFKTGELLTRLRNDDIFYVGWANNTNALSSEQFLVKYDLKGLIINVDDYKDSTTTYPCTDKYVEGLIYRNDPNYDYTGTCVAAGSPSWVANLLTVSPGLTEEQIKEARYSEQMDALAEEIYRYYWKANIQNIVLTDDHVSGVNLAISGADISGTTDALYTSGKWKVDFSGTPSLAYLASLPIGTPASEKAEFINWVNENPNTNRYLDDLSVVQFDLPGYYDIYYRDVYIKTIIAHELPKVRFNFKFACRQSPAGCGTSDSTQVLLTPRAFDPDRAVDSSVTTPVGVGGIATYEWKKLNLLDGSEHAEPFDPNDWEINDGEAWEVTLTVIDDLGAIKSYSEIVNYSKEDDAAKIQPPFAQFDINPKKFNYGLEPNDAVLINNSYDLQGYCIAPYWRVYKDGYPFYSAFDKVTLSADGLDPCTSYTSAKLQGFSSLDPGTYVIYLEMKNQFCYGFSPIAPAILQFDYTGQAGLFESAIAQYIFTGDDGLVLAPSPLECKTSVLVTQTITVVKDMEPPMAIMVPGRCDAVSPECPEGHLTGTTNKVTVKFTDTGDSGLALQRVAVTPLGSYPNCRAAGEATVKATMNGSWAGWLDSGLVNGSDHYDRTVGLTLSGLQCVHWWAIDRAGNENSSFSVFEGDLLRFTGSSGGPYDLWRSHIDLHLEVAPNEPAYPHSTVFGDPLVLTAYLGDEELDPNTVRGGGMRFNITSPDHGLEDAFLGSAVVVSGTRVAILDYIPTLPASSCGTWVAGCPIPTGYHTFTAVFPGSALYDPKTSNPVDYEIVGPDLQMEISASSYLVSVGDIVRIDFQIKNAGTFAAYDVYAMLTLPDELRVVPAYGNAPSPATSRLDPAGDWHAGMRWEFDEPMDSVPFRRGMVDPQATASVYVLVTDPDISSISAKVHTSSTEFELENNLATLVLGPMGASAPGGDPVDVEIAEATPRCRALTILTGATP